MAAPTAITSETRSMPGSLCSKAISAEASRTQLLTSGLGAAFGDQFVDE